MYNHIRAQRIERYRLRPLMRNATDCVFVQHVSELFCGSLFSAFIDFVVSFVDCLVCCVYDLSLCEFANGISPSRLIDTLFQVPSSLIVIAVGDTSIILNAPVFRGTSLLYDLVARRLAVDVVIGAL